MSLDSHNESTVALWRFDVFEHVLMLRRMCVVCYGGAHGAIDWLSGCCYGRLKCSAIGQALY